MDVINDSNIILAFRNWAFALGRFLCRLWHSHRVRSAGVALALVMILGVVDYERYLSGSDLPLEDYPAFSLGEYQRLIVFAPHCDDEVLGAAGLIQAALRQDIEVRIVIATHGDGYLFATMDEFKRAFPRPQDFISMGERRRQESLDALSSLGLPPQEATFLGYPDRGLASMWWSHWDDAQPFRSPYSQRDHSPYAHIRQPGAPYSGESLLRDLHGVLAEFQPDLVVLPHPLDEHPDHRALSAFVSLAVELVHADDPAYDPALLGYLVHYGMYPQHRRLSPLDGLRPPRQLEIVGDWTQWMLSSGDVAAKQRAVSAYRSQQRLLGAFLRRFVQPNEPFMRMEAATVLGIVEAETLPDAEAGEPVQSAQALPEETGVPRADDPVQDSVVRIARGGADIAGLRVFRWGDSLWVMLDLQAPVSRAYSYRLRVRVFSTDNTATWQGHYARADTDTVWARGDRVWFKLDREALGDPDWLAVTAETRQGVTLDHTAWHLIRLTEWPWEESDADGQE